jgi:LPS sulfotransferase NodH
MTKKFLEKRFANLVKGLEVDKGAFTSEMREKISAHTNYVILFTARSGSTWLTSILSATRLLGYPREYINPAFVRGIATATNSRDASGIIAILRRRRKTRNGVFGIEITSPQLQLYGEEEFFKGFEQPPIFFFLWRDNIVAQGISLYRAVNTKRFHSSDPPTPPPSYDVEEIARWIRQVAHVENRNCLLLRRRGIRPRWIRYEDIILSRSKTINLFAKVLDVRILPRRWKNASPQELQKIGDGWNHDAEERFRADQPDFIATIEENRRVKWPLRTPRPPDGTALAGDHRAAGNI